MTNDDVYEAAEKAFQQGREPLRAAVDAALAVERKRLAKAIEQAATLPVVVFSDPWRSYAHAASIVRSGGVR